MWWKISCPLNVVSQPTFVSLLKRLIYEDTLVGTNTAGTEQAEELLDWFMCVCMWENDEIWINFELVCGFNYYKDVFFYQG